MNLAIFLPLGSSLADLKKAGQDKRLVNYYLKKYLKVFDKVYIFSYKDEQYSLPENSCLVGNRLGLPRFLYTLLMPFLNWGKFKDIDAVRVTQLTGAVPGLLAKVLLKKPWLVTYGYNYQAFARAKGQVLRFWLLKLVEGLILNRADRVIVTRKKIKKRLSNNYPKADIVYLPNGVDVKQFRPAGPVEKKRQLVEDKKLELLFVGRLEKQKNLSSLIKAVASLKTKKELVLLLIGQGSQKAKLVKLAKDLKVDLRIVNRVSHDQLARFYQKADIFCLVSLREGQPKVLLEAMACGLACLVADQPWSAEFKAGQEVLKTKTSPGGIAKGLARLVKEQDLRKALGEKARKRVEKDFDINRLLEKEIQLLKNV